MKIKNTITVLFVTVILASCAPAAKVVPTETVIPNSTFSLAPTVTVTPTSIPTINIAGQNIPDPRFSNPDFFDVNNANSPFVQFANAFGIKPEETSVGLYAEMVTSNGMPSFAVMRTSEGVTLILARQDEDGAWLWEKATPCNYWRAQNKEIGVYIRREMFKNPALLEIYKNNFSEGIIALTGQILPLPGNGRPERKPSEAKDAFAFAKSAGMSVNVHYIAEPDRFQPDTNMSNVDQFIDNRLSGTADLVAKYNSTQSYFIEFNEGFESGNNPFKEKYGSKWAEEYIYRTLAIFISKGLIPNTDFMPMFNEGDMFGHSDKQQRVFHTLMEARTSAYNKLIQDQNAARFLELQGINSPEDIRIMLGAETHVVLGEGSTVFEGIKFERGPSLEQINTLADLFGSLGGIMLTEVNPINATEEQKREFLNTIDTALKNNPNIQGALFWNIFNLSAEGQIMPDDFETPSVFDKVLRIMNDDGSPTSLYYELLR